jgi:hypothetical protein
MMMKRRCHSVLSKQPFAEVLIRHGNIVAKAVNKALKYMKLAEQAV